VRERIGISVIAIVGIIAAALGQLTAAVSETNYSSSVRHAMSDLAGLLTGRATTLARCETETQRRHVLAYV